jgi:aminoglycoside phosphotransferase (APT) family kinase protein
MIEDQLGRCVASWYKGATDVTGAAKLSGGASQETWTFDIVHPSGNVGAVLRRAPPGYDVSPSPSRAAGIEAEAVLMQLAYEAGLPSPRVLHVLKPEEGLGRGFIMVRVEGETIARKILRDEEFAKARPILARQLGKIAAGIHALPEAKLPKLRTALSLRPWLRTQNASMVQTPSSSSGVRPPYVRSARSPCATGPSSMVE